MSRGFRALIERQIAKARAEGKLQGLAGEGAPLPDRSTEALADPGVAAGVRIMAEAGVVPEEFRIKAELAAARAAYQSLTDPAERKATMVRIADLEMRYNMERDARRKFLG